MKTKPTNLLIKLTTLHFVLLEVGQVVLSCFSDMLLRKVMFGKPVATHKHSNVN